MRKPTNPRPGTASKPTASARGTTLERRRAFAGRVIAVDVERVELPNGALARFELVRHPGGAAVVAVNARREVCLLHQYRHALAAWLWELPAGKLDGGESPRRCARRELTEEAGITAARWSSLGQYVSSPGVFTEMVHLFLATRLARARAQPDAGEVFEVRWIALERAVAMAMTGEISDGKTVVGLARAAAQLRSIKSKRRKS
jgi:ADP-ribose pyrophosphatase